MRWTYISFVLLLGIMIFCSCKKRPNNIEWREQAEYEIRRLVGKEVKYATNIFTPYSQSSIDSVRNAECKIVTSIDAGCTTCLSKFDYWTEFMNRIDSLSSRKVSIMLYVYSDFYDRQRIEEFMKERWSYLWAYDYNYEFLDKNELHDDRFQALILDESNIIKLIGNPYLNEEMEKLYVKYIISLNENTH